MSSAMSETFFGRGRLIAGGAWRNWRDLLPAFLRRLPDMGGPRTVVTSLVIALFVAHASTVATPKFSNEITFSSDMNWEPAIAADPNGGIYWAATRNVSQSVCEGCPNPGMSFRYSADNGRAFGSPLWVCMENCVGFPSQYDPVMAVNQRGSLHWAWMNWWNIVRPSSLPACVF